MIGIDFLALAKYPDVVIKSLPEKWALGFFHRVAGFGPALPAIKEILSKRNIPVIRVQMQWDDNHDFRKSHLENVAGIAKKYEELALQYPNTKFYLSPYCEHRLLKDSIFIEKAADTIAAVAPSCIFINDPEKPHGLTSKYLSETHNYDAFLKRPNDYQIFSFDGMSPNKAQVAKVLDIGKLKFIWWSNCNGRSTDKDSTPRPQRTDYPTTKGVTRFLKEIGL